MFQRALARPPTFAALSSASGKQHANCRGRGKRCRCQGEAEGCLQVPHRQGIVAAEMERQTQQAPWGKEVAGRARVDDVERWGAVCVRGVAPRTVKRGSRRPTIAVFSCSGLLRENPSSKSMAAIVVLACLGYTCEVPHHECGHHATVWYLQGRPESPPPSPTPPASSSCGVRAGLHLGGTSKRTRLVACSVQAYNETRNK